MASAAPAESAGGKGWPRILFVSIMLALVLTRFWGLDFAAFHHDESIHSKAIWTLAREGASAYRYDPVYHGPLFYHLGALASIWLPDTDFTARLPFAVAGLALVLSGLLVVPVAGWRAGLLAMTLLTISPTVTYYSRFAREDVVMTALLAWLVGAGAIYLRTPRLRWLTVAWTCVVLGYCNKENSYINGFVVCVFVVAWGVWTLLRGGAEGRRLVLGKYLPLTRLLIVYGLFSFFVFTFVALDSRVGADMSLREGLGGIFRHSVALSREAAKAAESLRGREGYFTAPGREGTRATFELAALAVSVVALALMEALATAATSIGARRRRSVLVCGLAALVGYGAAAIWLAEFFCWAGSYSGAGFLARLRSQLIAGWLLLSGLALLAALPPMLSSGMRRRTLGGAQRGRLLLRLCRPGLVGLWALAAQVILALGIYCALFSSLGTNAPAGLRAGLYDYVSYWFRQQTGEFRIWGEWWYYLPRLTLYEAAALAAVALCGVPLLRGAARGDGPSRGLAIFALWLTASMIVVYALLNEKVGWLAIYQAYALNLLAALLLARWMGCARSSAARWFVAGTMAVAIAFTCWQHAIAVHLHPDSPTEPMAFVTTSHGYLEEVRRVEQAHWSAIEAKEDPPLVALSGEGVWPGAWYLRRLRTVSAPFAPGARIRILDDTPENRRRLDSGDFVWETRAPAVRGWWFSHGEGLPAGGSLAGNIASLAVNGFNDHSAAFGPGSPLPNGYTTGFAAQLFRFVLFRAAWYPATGVPVLFAWETKRPSGRRTKLLWLEGFDRTAREAPIEARLGEKAALKGPRALAVLSNGAIAVADSGNGRVAVLDRDGKVESTIGDGILSAEVTGPCGLASGPGDVLYVADTWHHAVRAFSRDGRLLGSCSAVPMEGDAARFFGPRGIAVSPAGNPLRIYVADTGNCRIVGLDAQLKPLLAWGSRGGAPGLFDEPVGIVVDDEGSVFVADTGNGRIQQFDANGGFLREFPVYLPAATERLAAEPQLALLPDGTRIAMTYSTRGTFVVISPSENRAWPWKPAGDLCEPSGIAFSPDWELYLSDRRSGVVLRLAEGGHAAP